MSLSNLGNGLYALGRREEAPNATTIFRSRPNRRPISKISDRATMPMLHRRGVVEAASGFAAGGSRAAVMTDDEGLVAAMEAAIARTQRV